MPWKCFRPPAIVSRPNGPWATMKLLRHAGKHTRINLGQCQGTRAHSRHAGTMPRGQCTLCQNSAMGIGHTQVMLTELRGYGTSTPSYDSAKGPHILTQCWASASAEGQGYTHPILRQCQGVTVHSLQSGTVPKGQGISTSCWDSAKGSRHTRLTPRQFQEAMVHPRHADTVSRDQR